MIAPGEAVAQAANWARSSEKLLASGRHLHLILDDVQAILEVEPFLAPELGALLGAVQEAHDALARATVALDARYTTMFGIDGKDQG